jgi:hypothetical protein
MLPTPGDTPHGKEMAMMRIVLALYGIAAAVVALYPMVSEAGIIANHNETLVRDPR